MSAAEKIADLGYGAGWKCVRYLPESFARKLFDGGANYAATRKGGPEQLRKNLARVLGVDVADVPNELVAAAMRSYARYWREAFRLPSVDSVRAAESVLLTARSRKIFDDAVAAGNGIIFTLPHSGNWDLAGVWLVHNYGRFSTVAERLKPESLFEKFVQYRESLNFEIFPLSGGEQPPLEALAERLENGGVVCLMGDRDLTQSGVPVMLFGELTRIPVGPVKLAQRTGATLIPVHHSYRDADTSELFLDTPIDSTLSMEAACQQIAHSFERSIARAPQDWHMLQPYWQDDWSSARKKALGLL